MKFVVHAMRIADGQVVRLVVESPSEADAKKTAEKKGYRVDSIEPAEAVELRKPEATNNDSTDLRPEEVAIESILGWLVRGLPISARRAYPFLHAVVVLNKIAAVFLVFFALLWIGIGNNGKAAVWMMFVALSGLTTAELICVFVNIESHLKNLLNGQQLSSGGD